MFVYEHQKKNKLMHGKFVEWVYDSLMGNLAEQYRCKQVENLFEDGKPCMQCYSDAMEAYWRLCDRLGMEEDNDVEILIDSLLDMSKITACQMYEYGAKFGLQE